jgi:hypothetical protein
MEATPLNISENGILQTDLNRQTYGRQNHWSLLVILLPLWTGKLVRYIPPDDYSGGKTFHRRRLEYKIFFCRLSVVDPHWLQCGSVSSVLPQCGSGSREPSQCGCGSGSGSDFAVKMMKFLREKYALCTIGIRS